MTIVKLNNVVFPGRGLSNTTYTIRKTDTPETYQFFVDIWRFIFPYIYASGSTRKTLDNDYCLLVQRKFIVGLNSLDIFSREGLQSVSKYGTLQYQSCGYASGKASPTFLLIQSNYDSTKVGWATLITMSAVPSSDSLQIACQRL